MLEQIKAILSPIAPVLGGMLGGPMGAMAGTALKQLLCNNAEANDEELLQAVQAASTHPEQLLQLKRLDNDYRVQLRQLDVQEEAIHQQDRESARARQLKLLEHGHRDYTLTILAFGIVGIFFALALYILQLMKQGAISGEEGTIIGLLLGYAASELKQVTSYYFGSSKGSKDKDAVIESMKK